MIYTINLKLLSKAHENEAWSCSIEIPSDFSLEELHLIIQNALEFDDDHLYEYSISNSARGKHVKKIVCDSNEIHETTIESFFNNLDGKKVFYLFDYGDNWLFQLSRSRKKPFLAAVDINYPRVALETGVKPIQYPDWDE